MAAQATKVCTACALHAVRCVASLVLNVVVVVLCWYLVHTCTHIFPLPLPTSTACSYWYCFRLLGPLTLRRGLSLYAVSDCTVHAGSTQKQDTNPIAWCQLFKAFSFLRSFTPPSFVRFTVCNMPFYSNIVLAYSSKESKRANSTANLRLLCFAWRSRAPLPSGRHCALQCYSAHRLWEWRWWT